MKTTNLKSGFAGGLLKIRNSQFAIRNSLAFTLVELLVVLAILGILAALIVPALKNFGHSDATISASRQLLDDVARARQLAISQRTTVYMVFVPTNFWGGLPSSTALINLCDKQLTGYTFVSLRTMGDQPGVQNAHYLAPWQNLPDGAFIALVKFTNSPSQFYTITDPIDATKSYKIYGFNMNIFPFPTETTPITVNTPALPYIAFNYLGQLTTNGVDAVISPELIPLARGNVSPWIDLATKAYQLNPPQVSEIPPGNSTNAYNIIDIEPLTGRAKLLYHKMGP
ncbi:MAG: prepilin-type N-terminal cleavage/methylation domain-containing protein [Verrucomicrobiota bacterium]